MTAHAMGDVGYWFLAVIVLGLATLGLLTLLDWLNLTPEPRCPDCGRRHTFGPHHHPEWPDRERLP